MVLTFTCREGFWAVNLALWGQQCVHRGLQIPGDQVHKDLVLQHGWGWE